MSAETRDWPAILAAETAAAERRFAAAFRRAERLIAAAAAGEENDAAVLRAEDRLYRLGNAMPVDAATPRYDAICALKKRWIVAREAGAAVRQAARDAEIARLTIEIREAARERDAWR